MSQAISVAGKMLAFSRLRIHSDDIDAIIKEVSAHSSDEQISVVIESDKTLDLLLLRDRLWQLNIAVIGVMAGVLEEQARALQLAVFPDGKKIAHLDDVKTSEVAKPTQNNSHPSTHLSSGLTHNQLVRSGQTVHHMGSDLVLLKGVNTGAEVITDSNLHIYGKGQGRLVAGATGDENAKIFCQVFDPALVSVAGTYCLRDDMPAEFFGKAVMVSFIRDKGLIFEYMT